MANPNYPTPGIGKPMPDGPQGAQALADRLHVDCIFANTKDDQKWHRAVASSALGDHGLFVPDVSGHEPIGSARQEAAGRGFVDCLCGHLTTNEESYFDHLNRPTGGSEPIKPDTTPRPST